MLHCAWFDGQFPCHQLTNPLVPAGGKESDFPFPKIANLSIVSRTALGYSPERKNCPIANRGCVSGFVTIHFANAFLSGQRTKESIPKECDSSLNWLRAASLPNKDLC